VNYFWIGVSVPHVPTAATVLLFGAGTGSQIWLERNARSNEKYLILDNDSTLWGTTRHGIKICKPSLLKILEYRAVLVLLSHVTDVRNQLLALGVPTAAIIFPPKPDFRPQPFLSAESRQKALSELRGILLKAMSCGANLVVEQGTALGLYRTGDLIPWDNDIDLSVPWVDRAFLDLYAEYVQASGFTRDLVFQETRVGLIMSFTSQSTNVPFTIYTRRVERGWALAPDFHRVRPQDMWPSRTQADTEGHQYPLPACPERYFETIYGSGWQIPRRSFSFADYPQIRQGLDAEL
jgi:hypothetical protein